MELNPLRPALLAASKSGLLKQVATHTPLTKSVVERFVAGETRPDVLRACDSLLSSGRRISVDFLGENVTSERGAHSTAAEYVQLISDLAQLPAVYRSASAACSMAARSWAKIEPVSAYGAVRSTRARMSANDSS